MRKVRKMNICMLLSFGVLATVMMGGCSSSGSSSSGGNSSGTRVPGSSSAAANISGGSSSSDQKVYKITYAGTVADTHPMMISINQVAEEMKEESGGRLDMTVYPNNQLGDSRANLEAMGNGTIQVGEASSAPLAVFTKNYLPLSLPFFFESKDAAYAWVESDFAMELADKTGAECGFRPVAWYLNGVRTLTNSKRPVTSPADMEGLKIRVMENDIYIKAFEAMGASATPMSFAEVFTGLQQKTIDGQDNPNAINVTNAYYEVQSYWTDLKHTIDLAPIVVSEEWYQSLPDDLKEMFTKYMKKAAELERQMMDDQDGEYQETMATGCEMTFLTDEQRAVFKEKCMPVYTWFAEAYPDINLDNYLNAIK